MLKSAFEKAPLILGRASPEAFRTAVQEVMERGPVFRRNLDLKPDYSGFECWLSSDACAGYAVTPDRELVNVFTVAAGYGHDLLDHVTNQYSKLHLNCYSGFLVCFYEAAGFEPVRTEPNFCPGEPDVVYMEYLHPSLRGSSHAPASPAVSADRPARSARVPLPAPAMARLPSPG